MSLLLGLLLGLGLAFMWQAMTTPLRATPHRRSGLREELDLAGLAQVKPAAALSFAALLALATATAVWGLTHTPVVALAAGLGVLVLPWWWLGSRKSARVRSRRQHWPDVVDHLRSAVRSGVPLTEALAQLATTGPPDMRREFAVFAADLRVGRRTDAALESLRRRLADPIADRLIAAIVLTREVGGADVGEMLGTLAGFLRADIRTRGELEARQSWTVNAARLAVVAPWVILLILCLEPRVGAAYATPAGILVLAGGALVAAVSYRWMLSVARLDPRQRPLAEAVPDADPRGGTPENGRPALVGARGRT